MNALAHCCEALYVKGRDPTADPLALEGADEISDALPRVLDDLGARDAREALLRGAAKAGEALGALGPRARARDGAGDRRPLRASARRAERDLPAGGRCGSTPSSSREALLGGRAAERAEELARARGLHDAGRARRPAKTTCPSWRARSRSGRERSSIRVRRRRRTCSSCCLRSSNDRNQYSTLMSARTAAADNRPHGGRNEPRRARRHAGPPLTGRRRRLAGSHSPSSRSFSAPRSAPSS